MEIDFELLWGARHGGRRAVAGWREDLDTYYAMVTDQEDVLVDLGTTVGEITDIAVALDALRPHVDSDQLDMAAVLLPSARAMNSYWDDDTREQLSDRMDYPGPSRLLGGPLLGSRHTFGADEAEPAREDDGERQVPDNPDIVGAYGSAGERDEDLDRRLVHDGLVPREDDFVEEPPGHGLEASSGLGY